MTSTDNNHPRTGPSVHALGIIPRLRQSGVHFLDNTNVTEFLRRRNIECEDCGLSEGQKCAQLPDYCSPKIKILLNSSKGTLITIEARGKLQEELKDLFWQYDKHKNTPATLNQFIRDIPSMDLNINVLKYAAITDALIKGNEMLAMQHWKRFLDGLSDQLRDKAFDCCIIQDWKLSVYDTGIKDPDFGQLKKHILTKAQSTKKMIYNKECAIKGYEDLKDSITSIFRPSLLLHTSPAPTSSPAPSSASSQAAISASALVITIDSIAELTNQLCRLTLLIQANMQSNHFSCRCDQRCIYAFIYFYSTYVHLKDCQRLQSYMLSYYGMSNDQLAESALHAIIKLSSMVSTNALLKHRQSVLFKQFH